MLLLLALPVIGWVQSSGLSPEQIEQLTTQYGAEQAQEIVDQFRQEQSGLILSILGASLLNLSVWIYTGITAAIVYGRFNVYSRRKR
jgi:hypothetical protein